MSCGVGCRRSSDPALLLWLWRRPVATAPIRPLAWCLKDLLLLQLAFPGLGTSICRECGLLKKKEGVPIVAQWLTNPTRNHEVVGLIPGLAQWGKVPAFL